MQSRSFEMFHKRMLRRNDFERMRKEKYSPERSRIIFESECTARELYRRLCENTAFVYRNRIADEGVPLKKLVKNVRRKNAAFGFISVFALIAEIVSLYLFLTVNWKDMENTAPKIIAMMTVMFGPLAIFCIGCYVKCSGRALMGEYIEIANGKTPIDIFSLKNGQIAVVKYYRKDRSEWRYHGALNSEEAIINGVRPTRETSLPSAAEAVSVAVSGGSRFPSTIEYAYIIEKVSSCSEGKNGLIVETSGRSYGIRNGSYMADGKKFIVSVSTELSVSCRKEEIPTIFTDMDRLENALMNYGDHENSPSAVRLT